MMVTKMMFKDYNDGIDDYNDECNLYYVYQKSTAMGMLLARMITTPTNHTRPFQSYQDELDCLDDYSMGVCFSSDGRKMAFLKRRGGVCLTPMNSQQPLPQDKPCTCHLNKSVYFCFERLSI